MVLFNVLPCPGTVPTGTHTSTSINDGEAAGASTFTCPVASRCEAGGMFQLVEILSCRDIDNRIVACHAWALAAGHDSSVAAEDTAVPVDGPAKLECWLRRCADPWALQRAIESLEGLSWLSNWRQTHCGHGACSGTEWAWARFPPRLPQRT